uniref:Putative secreted protein n=1 Tax=Anopheles darlingi TaxID=43151 RepID=A0A2M4D9C9_ANODA
MSWLRAATMVRKLWLRSTAVCPKPGFCNLCISKYNLQYSTNVTNNVSDRVHRQTQKDRESEIDPFGTRFFST